MDYTGIAGNRAKLNLDRPIYPRSYSPAPPIPAWFARGLLRKGGRNEHGGLNFQIGWGMDLRDARGRIKYMNPHDWELGWTCFILERWAPPTFFDEVEWNELRFDTEMDSSGYADLLGEYPRNGTYIYVGALATMDADGLPYEPLPLSTAVLDDLTKQIGYGSIDENKAMARLAMQKQLRKVQAQKSLRKALDDNKEEWNSKRKDSIIAQVTRHTVAPSVNFPVKSTLDEKSGLFIPKGSSYDTANAS